MTDHAIAVMVTHSEVCPNQILELSGGDVSAVVDHIAGLQEKVLRLEEELARRDAAAGEPFAYVDSSHLDEFGWGYVFKQSSPMRAGCKFPVYAAAPPALLPPELSFNEALQLMHEYRLVGDANSFLMGANWMREQCLALGAQQQQVVELPCLSKDTLRELAALEAANVKLEVKK